MAELRPDAFLKRVAGEALPPVILIAGDEPLLVQECADAVRAKAKTEGYAEREVLDAEGSFDWNRLTQGLASLSLFAQRRLFDLRLPTGKPGKDGSEAIRDYCANPPPDTVLMVTSLDWSRQHAGKWSEAIAAAGYLVPVWPLKANELPDWLATRLRRKGLAATPDALERLVERVEGNLLAAAQEIDKLSLLIERDAGPIDLETLERLVAEASRYDVFKLFDAALAGDAARVPRILAGLRGEGEQVAGLLGYLLKEIGTIAGFAAVQAGGGNVMAEMRAAKLWESKLAQYKRALDRHPPSSWERFAIAVGEVERISKGRASGDAWRALERLLLAIARPRAAATLLAG
jgi:DNA polymerase-3 subunit delta